MTGTFSPRPGGAPLARLRQHLSRGPTGSA
jgi:hypothetical protein